MLPVHTPVIGNGIATNKKTLNVFLHTVFPVPRPSTFFAFSLKSSSTRSAKARKAFFPFKSCKIGSQSPIITGQTAKALTQENNQQSHGFSPRSMPTVIAPRTSTIGSTDSTAVVRYAL